jgi:NAD(P)H-dependent FMN reductase
MTIQILALSGSTRRQSTNTALLRALADCAPKGISVRIYDGIGALPIFSPDLEGPLTPRPVEDLALAIEQADGLVVACPEYIRSLPGGFKNALDWLVSREEVITKPMAILHGSHRGDDALAALRTVLGTISTRFSAEVFERFECLAKSPEDIAELFSQPAYAARLRGFLSKFQDFIDGAGNPAAVSAGNGMA